MNWIKVLAIILEVAHGVISRHADHKSAGSALTGLASSESHDEKPGQDPSSADVQSH